MATRKTATMANNEISIRMYNVGFGDAFLVTLPTEIGTKRLLFDCGSIAKGAQSMSEIVKQIVSDCKDGDERSTIDVVVATHRHRDHVSGFASEVWNQVNVKEVWMPWTEDPKDPKARDIRESQSRLRLALTKKLALTTSLNALATDIDGPVDRLAPIDELLLNALSNERAMDMLHHGFLGAPKRRFLPEKIENKDELVRSFKTDVLPGVTIHVLGPSHSKDIIRDMDPPKAHRFLQLESAKTMLGKENEEWSHFKEFSTTEVPEEFEKIFSQSDRTQIEDASIMSDFDVAVALDQAINGTSLMVILEFRNQYLLFPGDAQWGTWNAALQDNEWCELLSRATFYKIGHHGSNNATPVDFVNNMHENTIAMVSTLTREQWKDIPRVPLLNELSKKKAKIARSDMENDIDLAVFSVKGDYFIETKIQI